MTSLRICLIEHNNVKKKNKKKELVPTALVAVISVCVGYDNSTTTPFAAPLDFKLFYFLEDMLLQIIPPSFLLK